MLMRVLARFDTNGYCIEHQHPNAQQRSSFSRFGQHVRRTRNLSRLTSMLCKLPNLLVTSVAWGSFSVKTELNAGNNFSSTHIFSKSPTINSNPILNSSPVRTTILMLHSTAKQ
jgi:hypothetical protein